MALNSQLQTYQILTNYDQMLILGLSYFITTVLCAVNLIMNECWLWDYFWKSNFRIETVKYVWMKKEGNILIKLFVESRNVFILYFYLLILYICTSLILQFLDLLILNSHFLMSPWYVHALYFISNVYKQPFLWKN